jgi:iron complex transport system ATP-binding protein
MLTARHLWVKIRQHTLLADVSLDLQPGEVVAVIGPNGAGKSTLLRLLCGDLSPTQGNVCLEGSRLATWPLRQRAQRMAVLLQEAALVFPFTVLEVVLMGRTPHLCGTEGPGDYAIAHATLTVVDMLALAQRSYPTLSGGERQRVQLARVLAQVWDAPARGACYLLLDEPMSSLDLAHQHSILATVRHFARQGAGVLTILHDLNLAAQYADRIVLLKAGRQLATGHPYDVLTSEAIFTAFMLPVHVLPHPSLPCPLVVPATTPIPVTSPGPAGLSVLNLS